YLVRSDCRIQYDIGPDNRPDCHSGNAEAKLLQESDLRAFGTWRLPRHPDSAEYSVEFIRIAERDFSGAIVSSRDCTRADDCRTSRHLYHDQGAYLRPS